MRTTSLFSFLMAICMLMTTATSWGSPVVAATNEIGNTGDMAQRSDLAGHWAAPAMERWLAYGLLKGDGNGRLSPDKPATRAEFVALINGLFKFSRGQQQPFTDVQSDSWYAQDVAAVYAAGVINGVGSGKFAPQSFISREDAAVIVDRAFELTSAGTEQTLTPVKDAAQIAGYAVDAVSALYAGGYVRGKEGQRFDPKEKITKAEIVQLIDNVMGTLINQPTTYSQAVNGNLVVSAAGVTLKNMVIAGNLYVTQGIGEGDLTLDGVTVKGNVYVWGGSEKGIRVRDSSLQALIVDRKGLGSIRIIASGKTEITHTMLKSAAMLEEVTLENNESGFLDVEVRIPAQIQPKGVRLQGQFREVGNYSTGTSFELDAATVVNTMRLEAAATVTGKGSIRDAWLLVNGITLEQWPDKVNFAKGVSAIIASRSVTRDDRKHAQADEPVGPSNNGGTGNPPTTTPEEPSSTSLRIVHEGQPVAAIRVALDADQQTTAAAAKLAAYVKKSTGAELPILANNEALPIGAETEIYVGKQGLQPANGEPDPLAGLDGDGFVIKQYGDRITIAGPTAWGTEFGVNAFLEKYIGVRWLAPGEDWEDVPQVVDLAVPVNDTVVQQPAFFSREFDLHATNTPEREQWARNNRMHGRVEFKHNLFELFPPAVYKDTHPEFYPQGAYLDHHGGWQPCFTAEGIVDEAIKNINAYFDAHPEATSYSLGVNDGLASGSGYCEDNPNHPDYPNQVNSLGNTNMSDIYYKWVDEVSKGVFAVHGDKYLGLLAYVEVYDPPTDITLDPRVIVYITDDRLTWGSPGLKAEGHGISEQWVEAAPGLAYYEYLWGTPYMVPRTYFNLMDDNYKYANQVGVKAHYAEMVPNFGEGPKPWISTRLQWDPQQNTNLLLQEWYVRAVGETAAADLAAYYEIWRDFWENRMFQTEWYADWFGNEPRWNYLNFLDDSYLEAVTQQDIATSRSLLESVVAKASTAKQKKRAADLLRSFEYYEASVLSHTVEKKAVPAPADEAAALTLVNTVMEKIRLAEKRRDLIVAFKDDSFLQQAFSPYSIDSKTLGGYTRVWSGISKAEMDAIVSWLKQEQPAGAVHALLEQLSTGDPVEAVRLYTYILLRSADPQARKQLNANPGFELAGATPTQAEAWNLWLHDGLELSRTNEVKRGGTSSIKARGVTLGGVIQTVPLQSGIHELSFAYYSPAEMTGKGTIRLQLDLWSATNHHLGTIRPYLETRRISDTAGQWSSMYWVGELPEGIAKVDAYALTENMGADQVVYIDDFYLNRLSPDPYENSPKIPLNLNWSFEEANASTPAAADSWNSWVYQGVGAIERSDEVKRDGSYAIKATGVGILGGIYQQVPVHAGVHGMSAAYYAPEGSNGSGTIQLQLELYDASNNHMGNILSLKKMISSAAGEWAIIDWTGELPAGVANVSINVLVGSMDSSEIVYLDETKVYRLSPDAEDN